MSNQYEEYLKSDYWKTVAKAVKVRAGYKCQVCNSPHDLHAHHRTYEHRGNELEHLSDLVCLCRRCHAIFHGKEQPEPVSQRVWRAQMPVGYDHRFGPQCIDHAAVERDMPPGEGDIVLTKELVDRCRTVRNGFTNATVIPFGLKFPLPNGWAKRLVGRTVSRDAYRQALQGRYIQRYKPSA